jgi:mRNA interferase RelE/StbE
MIPPEEVPDAPQAEVWLTAPAEQDLGRLDGSALVWALKKMLLLETDPDAGQPLLGALVGFRKLTVGNRDWRIVWRHRTDDRGVAVVEVSEVWAVGARSDGEVYAEMRSRLATLPDNPARQSLHAVLQRLGSRTTGVQARRPPAAPAAPEQWLVDRLVHTAGLRRADVAAMTGEEAVDAWTAYMLRSRPRDG